MYNLERQLWYLHLLTRHCPYNLLPEPSSPKHEYRGKLWGQPMTSSMTSSPWKYFFLHYLGRSFHMWCQMEAVFTLWPGDFINDVMNMYLHKCSHNLTIPMHRKFCDDIFACFLVIMKNVVISFIKEYRGPTLRPPCDVIDHVIIMIILFLAKFGTIFSYLRSDWSCVNYFKIFKMAAILSSRQNFFPEIIPEVEYTRMIAMSISNILSFWSTL